MRFLWIDRAKACQVDNDKRKTNTKNSFEISFFCVCASLFSSFLNSYPIAKCYSSFLLLTSLYKIMTLCDLSSNKIWFYLKRRNQLFANRVCLFFEKKDDCLTTKTVPFTTWMCTQFMIHLVNVLFLNKMCLLQKLYKTHIRLRLFIPYKNHRIV